jgi:L-alanine-DL-glutamate epimerase-like enolase superfamily enzyme
MNNKIAKLETALYRIPLPVTLSDSTHGTMTHFELITARVFDADGAEGMGYTYTVGANGGAVHSQIQRDLTPLLLGQPADLIESLWRRMWWGLHYGGAAAAPAAIRRWTSRCGT